MNFLNYIAPSAMVAFTLSPSASIQAQNNISIPINISFGEYCEVLETPSAISLTASRGENLHYDFGISWRCVGGTGKQVGISFMPITLPNGSEVVITRRGEQAQVTFSEPALFDVMSGVEAISHFTTTVQSDDVNALAGEVNWSGALIGVLELN